MHADLCIVVEYLPLQIGYLDHVVIYDTQLS
jgi:hypothetical protein